MTRVFTTADIKEEKSTSWLSCKFPIASSRVLTTMFHMPIWINKQFILMVTSEALIHAACFVLFMSIKGPVGQKISTGAVITLIVGCCGLFTDRGLGHLLHERLLKGLHVTCVPKKGYYKSLQCIVLVSVFPVRTFNNVCGLHISLVRGISLFAHCWGPIIGVHILQQPEKNYGLSVLGSSEAVVYVYAGLLNVARWSKRYIWCRRHAATVNTPHKPKRLQRLLRWPMLAVAV